MMIQQPDYSIHYSSVAGPGGDGSIVIPGEVTPAANASGTREHDDGVIITPDPSGIVIKTRLMEGKQCHFAFDDDSAADSYVPPSLSGIYSGHGGIDGGSTSPTDDGTPKGKGETKVFLNVCTHPLISVPGQRKGLDEQTGKEIDGWRLPMSVGELRPCYDKSGAAAVAADCVLNPRVVREMNSDPNHFQFVCDLIVQCASRKFGRSWFGGVELDRRFKLPKMKYAGYFDEATGLPIVPESAKEPSIGMASQKAVVAKQRVKGHGGKSAIIEEVESSPPPHSAMESGSASGNKIMELHAGGNKAVETTVPKLHCVELFVDTGDDRISLLDFLRAAADRDGVLSNDQPSTALRELLRSPSFKSRGSKGQSLHDSQLLKHPLPWDVTAAIASLGTNSSGGIVGKGGELDCWSIVAKCSVPPDVSSTKPAAPTVELSAFLLIVSTSDARTGCVLPFPVDTHQASSTYDPKRGVLEICMPLLQGASNKIDGGPDPGTRQWELQNALGGGNKGASNDGMITADGKASSMGSERQNDSTGDLFGSYCFINDPVGGEEDDDDDVGPLPEDAFHSQDALSRHLLHQQEEERAQRAAKNGDRGRDGADVEYINVEDFRPKRAAGRDGGNATTSVLKDAERVAKENLRDRGSMVDLVVGLV